MIQVEVPRIPHAGSLQLLRTPLPRGAYPVARSKRTSRAPSLRTAWKRSSDCFLIRVLHRVVIWPCPMQKAPCLSRTYTLTGASLCLRLILMISATIKLGTQLAQAVAWYAAISSTPKAT